MPRGCRACGLVLPPKTSVRKNCMGGLSPPRNSPGHGATSPMESEQQPPRQMKHLRYGSFPALLCRFGNSGGLSFFAGRLEVDINLSQASHVSMAKLEPRRGGVARAWIAALLAWLLACQGFGAFASSHSHWGQSIAGQTVSQAGQDCGATPARMPSAPCHHDHCECCILCASGHANGPALIGVIVSAIALFSAPPITVAAAWRFSRAENKPPSGWTSSWSQRAPPRFS